jgi:hypothetical protein
LLHQRPSSSISSSASLSISSSSTSISSTPSRASSYNSWPIEWPDPPPRKFIDWFCAKAFSSIEKSNSMLNTDIVIPLPSRPNSVRRSSKRTVSESQTLSSNTIAMPENESSPASMSRKKLRMTASGYNKENVSTASESREELVPICQHCQCQLTQKSTPDNSIDSEAPTVYSTASLEGNITSSLPSVRSETASRPKLQRSLSSGPRTRKTCRLERRQSLIYNYFTAPPS